jgi:hypothetical protein
MLQERGPVNLNYLGRVLPVEQTTIKMLKVIKITVDFTVAC